MTEHKDKEFISEQEKIERVAEMNTRGVVVWDAMLIFDQTSGEMVGYEKYGIPSTAHAEIAPDGELVFIVHSSGEDVPGKVRLH